MERITLDTPFGQMLHDLAADSRYKIYLESGCLDGEGTTKCLVAGLESRGTEDLSGAGLFSVEINKDLWMVASRYWQDRNPPLRILWGRLGDRMMSGEKARAHPLFNQDTFDTYHAKNVDWFVKTRAIRFRRCDVWICDGGEFSTEGDWDSIRALKPKVVAINGTKTIKGHDLFNLLFLKTGWTSLFLCAAGEGSAILEAPSQEDDAYPPLPIWRPAEGPTEPNQTIPL